MSRFPNLKLALVSALALSSTAGLCCPAPVDQTAALRLKRGELAEELAACIADDLACDVLCTELLAARGYGFSDDGYPPQVLDCVLDFDDAGPERPLVTIRYYLPDDCAGGRRPAQQTTTPFVAHCAVGQRLAAVAHLEAISVRAFLDLARDLSAHGAPRELVSRAVRCAADEVAHAQAIAELARQRGALVALPTVGRWIGRDLEAIATTNAIEGCARELYGAAIALWQAENAATAEMRAVFAEIADDELRHAQLALDIHAWALSRLDSAAAARVDEARVNALASLSMNEPDEETQIALGLPSSVEAQAIARAVVRLSE